MRKRSEGRLVPPKLKAKEEPDPTVWLGLHEGYAEEDLGFWILDFGSFLKVRRQACQAETFLFTIALAEVEAKAGPDPTVCPFP
jgi:hypothetical protein